MTTHDLKVQPPYFDALRDGTKTFEVRKNDRAYQAGDTLRLFEHSGKYGECDDLDCGSSTCARREVITKRVTFVYSGDPRFGGLEPGFVVLALGDTPDAAHAAHDESEA